MIFILTLISVHRRENSPFHQVISSSRGRERQGYLAWGNIIMTLLFISPVVPWLKIDRKSEYSRVIAPYSCCREASSRTESSGDRSKFVSFFKSCCIIKLYRITNVLWSTRHKMCFLMYNIFWNFLACLLIHFCLHFSIIVSLCDNFLKILKCSGKCFRTISDALKYFFFLWLY